MTTPAAATSSTSGATSKHPDGGNSPTVLTSLHTLLRAHVSAHPSPTLPYLHPYRPLPSAAWKGKARAALPGPEGQVEALRKLKEVVEGAQTALARGRDEKERIRLARALREVITTESMLLPLGTTLSCLPPAQRATSDLITLAPAELLGAVCKRLGLQVFTEDSQFGLLRTSLTIAGARFVVDIDLEADAPEGEDDGTEPPTEAPSPSAATVPRDIDRGKVRLVKVTANHVTPSGEDGKSDWVARVLRGALGKHLAVWNSAVAEQREAGLKTTVGALYGAFTELKVLDELAEAAAAGSADYFADLEVLAAALETATSEGHDADKRLYPDVNAGLYPSFRLLDSAPGLRNPALRLRPASPGESVPPPLPESTNGTGDANGASNDAMAVDPSDVGICKGSWLVELIDENPTPCAGGRGLVVRRTWLQSSETEESEASAYAPSIKLEGLLYQAALEAASSEPSLPLFPYGAEFVHHPAGLAQHWSLAHPGPEGYVVGRVGVPSSWDEFGRLTRALRAQLVLNVLFATAFDPAMQVQPDADDDSDDDMDADLDAAPTAVPLTVTLHQKMVRVALPLELGGGYKTITLELRPSTAAPYMAATATGELDDAQLARVQAAVAAASTAAGRDVVALVRGVVEGLK